MNNPYISWIGLHLSNRDKKDEHGRQLDFVDDSRHLCFELTGNRLWNLSTILLGNDNLKREKNMAYLFSKQETKY